jgi:hypothetical protein
MAQFDAAPPGARRQEADIGKEAEQALLDALSLIPGMRVRHATPEEDSGRQEIVKDPAIDVVGYVGEKPAFAVQLTTASDSVVLAKKKQELLDRPFIRLRNGEMGPGDTAIPRALVIIDAKSAHEYFTDPDITKHPLLRRQIADGLILNMKLALMKTKNPKEQQLVHGLLDAFTVHRRSLDA